MTNSSTSQPAVIVPASAGSGKTYRIAHEYIRDVLRDRELGGDKVGFDKSFYKRILAVTFTNKATEEMKSRILKEIHLLASNKESGHLKKLMEETKLSEATLRERARIVRSQILHDYSHFTVLTNDTFFQRILRAFMRELDIEMNFSTELDTAPVLSKSIEALIEDIPNNSELRGWLQDIVSDCIADGTRCDIRTIIGSLSRELFNESTRDIINNICDKTTIKEAVDAFEKEVDAATGKVADIANEMVTLVSDSGFESGNFKDNIIDRYIQPYAQDNLKPFNKTLESRLSLEPQDWVKAKKGIDMGALVNLAAELKVLLNSLYEALSNAKILSNTLSIIKNNYRSFALLNDLQAMIATICQQENSMLLNETKHTIASFISDDEVPFIYEKVGNYFDKFMIDEFQDTSVKEWRNFLPLLYNAMSQSTESDQSVLIVGDVKQSIYRWRGGDWRILGREVEGDLHHQCERVPLDSNWRSLPHIVDFNNDLFDRAVAYENERLNALIDEASASGVSEECKAELRDTLLHAYEGHTQEPCRSFTQRGYISITASTTENEELVNNDGMPLYIERIREVLQKGFLPRDITILVRKNKEAMAIAEEMLQHRKSFPAELWFDITTEEALSLISSPAVKLIVAIMHLAIERDNIASRVLYSHLHNHDRFGEGFSDDENSFFDHIRTMSPIEAFNQIAIRYAADLEGQSAYVLSLQENIARFSANKSADLELFYKWWQENSEKLSIKVERSDRAIQILTIHKAKGLENKVIFIPRCSWLMVPHMPTGRVRSTVWAAAKGNNNLEKIGMFPVTFGNAFGESLFVEGYLREMVHERVDAMNLLYVAVTRAGEQLHIYLPKPSIKINAEYSVNHMLRAIYDGLLDKKGDKNYLYHEVGLFEGPEPEQNGGEKITTAMLNEYRVSPMSLQLSTPSSRYFADEQGALSPRLVGIRLHHAFEQAATREDIFAALEEMVLSGELNQGKADMLKRQITNTLDTTIAGEWFDGSWDRILCERGIILKGGVAKRPDRALLRGKEAVVVDYKFGRESNKHIEQVEEYINALLNMGYTSVKGYVWYVPTGKIVELPIED